LKKYFINRFPAGFLQNISIGILCIRILHLAIFKNIHVRKSQHLFEEKGAESADKFFLKINMARLHCSGQRLSTAFTPTLKWLQISWKDGGTNLITKKFVC